MVLDQVRLNDEPEDIRIWKPVRYGGFSCKSALVALQRDDGVQNFEFYKFIWKFGIPIRIKFFAWSLSLKKINTCEVLQRKRPFQCLHPSWCVMCKQDQKSFIRLFLQGKYARMLWLKVLSKFGVAWDVLNNILILLHGPPNARSSNKIRDLWVCVVWDVLWGIWNERNSRIFSNMYDSEHNLWDKIIYWVAIWVKNHKDFKHFSIFVLSMGWSSLL